MTVVTRLRASGRNFAFHVSKAFAAAHKLDISSRYFMAFEAGKIIIETLPEVIDSESEERGTAAMMLADFTPENTHKDLLKGPINAKDV